MLYYLVLNVVFLVFLYLWLRNRRYRMSILSRCGIPGPKPHLIFGNMFDKSRGRSMVEKQKILIEKYGKIVGYYSGARFNVLVADPELAKMIQIKDFHNFVDRTIYIKYRHPTPKFEGSIIHSCGQRWRQIRTLLSPTFSSAKLKAMTPLVDGTINSLLLTIERQSNTGEEFNIYDLYLKMAAESILITAFGLKAEFQNNLNNDLIEAAENNAKTKVYKNLVIIYDCFPELSGIIHWIKGLINTIQVNLGLSSIGVLSKESYKIMRMRRENPSFRRNDLLQAMLDSQIDTRDISAISDDKLTTVYDENSNRIAPGSRNVPVNEGTTIGLTEDEVMVNCVVFFGAGYETSSTGLAYVTHFLVNYPEVQQKIREEVKELYKREGKLDYNTITGLKYMEWVFNEAMRIYPPLITGSTRTCLSDYKYKDIIIPKGAMIAVTTHYIHHNPDYWTEPEKFDPMRFSPENPNKVNPSLWQAFGNGPRNCIGMRFAYLVMKLTLAKLLLGYRLEAGPSTEIGKLQTRTNVISMTPRNGVFIRAIKLTDIETI